jgi:hypothetical protein
MAQPLGAVARGLLVLPRVVPQAPLAGVPIEPDVPGAAPLRVRRVAPTPQFPSRSLALHGDDGAVCASDEQS